MGEAYNFNWCGLGDSNSWPLPWQGSALTAILFTNHGSYLILVYSFYVLFNSAFIISHIFQKINI
nr:MAG TPA: hypothetical protein [Bacteriophage sp.]